MNAVQKQEHGHGHKHNEGLEKAINITTEYLKKYWRPTALAIAVILVAVISWQSYANRKASEFQLTWAALAELPSPHPFMQPDEKAEMIKNNIETCQRLLSERWNTEATPWVMLRLANAHLELGEPAPAVELLTQIKREYPHHHAYSLAVPKLAGALESLNQYERAAAVFQELAGNEPENIRWWVAVGRNHEFAQNKDQAITAYENALAHAGNKNKQSNFAEFRKNALLRDAEFLTPMPDPVSITDLEEEEEVPAISPPEMEMPPMAPESTPGEEEPPAEMELPMEVPETDDEEPMEIPVEIPEGTPEEIPEEN